MEPNLEMLHVFKLNIFAVLFQNRMLASNVLSISTSDHTLSNQGSQIQSKVYSDHCQLNSNILETQMLLECILYEHHDHPVLCHIFHSCKNLDGFSQQITIGSPRTFLAGSGLSFSIKNIHSCPLQIIFN